MRKIRMLIFILIICVSCILGQDEEEQLNLKVKLPTTAVGCKIASFGIPDAILDMLPFYEIPTISGTAFAFEIRSFGDKGLNSGFSGLYSFEYSIMSGIGVFRDKQHTKRLEGSGEITQISLTATVILSLFPKLPVGPYIGAGIGIGRISIWAEGVSKDEVGTEIKETFENQYIIPVGHLPVGIAIKIANMVEIRIEAGFKNGFYFGGSATYCF